MKRLSLLFIPALLFSYSMVWAQHADGLPYSKVIIAKQAKAHLAVLASDALAGREMGEEGGREAAAYIEKTFRKIGLHGPVAGEFTQSIAASAVRLEQSLQINGQHFEPITDFYSMPAGVSLGGFDVKTDSIVFAGYGTINESKSPYYNNFSGQRLEGKVVMLVYSDAANKVYSLDNKMRYLAFHKVKAVLIVHPLVDNIPPDLGTYLRMEETVLPGSEALAKLQATEQGIPTVFIGTRAADALLAGIGSSLSAMSATLDAEPAYKATSFKAELALAASKKMRDLQSVNVLGYLPGSDPTLKDELLIVSAHYDHLGITTHQGGVDSINNGADDNGSGTTGIMLIAEAFMKASKAGKGPKRSILFTAFTGEEKGLIGSSHYVAEPVFPLEKTIVNLNVDMIGRTDTIYKNDPNYIYIIGADRISADLDKTIKSVNDKYTQLQLDEKFNVRSDPMQLYYRSDHYNFAKNNIPVTFFFSGFHDDYHRVGDEKEKIDFDALCKRAKLIFFTAWELANR